MKILVVCGAGASSTFVAQRLQRAAALAGHDWQTAAGTESSAGTAFADLLLVGPHLADRVEAIRSATSAPITVLPDDVFGDRDGTRTLAIAEEALSQTAPAETPPTVKGRP